jgi:hypothetical protein
MTLDKKLFDITHNIEKVMQKKAKGMAWNVTMWNDVADNLREQLFEHRLLIVPHVLEHTKEGNLTSATVKAEIIDIDTQEKKEVGNYVGYGYDNQDKGIGKAITYAYKYLLMKTFMMKVGIEEESELNNVTVEFEKPKNKGGL